MKSAALIMHIEDAVMMIGIWRCGRDVAVIAVGLGRGEYIQRMFVDQRRDAGDLGKRKQPDEPVCNCSGVRHAHLLRQAKQLPNHHKQLPDHHMSAAADSLLRECRIARFSRSDLWGSSEVF